MKTQQDLARKALHGQNLFPMESAATTQANEHRAALEPAGQSLPISRTAALVHVAHRFPLRISPYRDPSAYLLSPARLLTRRADDFRQLRAHLNMRLAFSGILLMVSARHAEGRSLAGLNLSIAFAQEFRRVVYLEADFRRPTLRTFFDVPASKGMADLLREPGPLGDLSTCVLATDVAGLYLLPAGTRPGPPDLFESPRLPEVFAWLRSVGDWIIVDCPPLLSYPDALSLIGLVDGVVVVAQKGRTREEDLEDLSGRLAHAHAHIVGTIFIER
ncbi:MAG TPA: CpsD/CapB family tyrosine-protein kinase [Ktedonobacterales bacterium]